MAHGVYKPDERKTTKASLPQNVQGLTGTVAFSCRDVVALTSSSDDMFIDAVTLRESTL